MTAMTASKRRAKALPNASMSFRWDERWKRWDVTITSSAGKLLASTCIESDVPMDRVTASLCLTAVRDALEGMLPLA